MDGAWPAGQQWAYARAADLQNVWQVLRRSHEQRVLPNTGDFAPGTLVTSLAVISAPAVLAVLANRKGRKLILDAIETVLASILVILLLSIVLGLPVGAMYLVYKAVSFILRSLWRSAAVSSALAALRTQLLQP